MVTGGCAQRWERLEGESMIAAGHKGKRKGVGVAKIRRLAGTSTYKLKASSNRALVDGNVI